MQDVLAAATDVRINLLTNHSHVSKRYSHFLLQEFILQIESKYRVHAGRAGRAITGISMGGYGAFRFAFARPELFSAVSAQSAALITETPQRLNAASNAGLPLLAVLSPVFGKPVAERHWNDNNPFLLAKRN